jgi:hypothetical protein
MSLLRKLLLLNGLAIAVAGLTITHTPIGSAPPLPLGTPHVSIIGRIYPYLSDNLVVAAS